jgi:hypothetical protein
MPLTRYLLLRVPPASDENHLRTKRAHLSIQVGGIHHLRDTLRELSRIAGYTISTIEAYVRLVDSDVDTLEESMLDIRNVLASARMHLSISVLRDPTSALLASFEISHLVAAAEDGLETGWHFSQGAASATAAIPTEKWSLLVHDVLLDIAIFHSRRGLVRRFGPSASRARQFSRMKAAFIVNAAGSDTFYGRIHGNAINANYLPMAAICRTPDGLDLRRLHELWNELDRSANVKGTLTLALDYIMAFHPRAGQLSRKRLISVIPTAPGSYILVRGEKRPKNPPLSVTIPSIMGTDRRSWHAGRLRVVNPMQGAQLRQYFPYLSLFPFEVL